MSTSNVPAKPPSSPAKGALPAWATELISQYESGAASQFILHGNVADTTLLPLAEGASLGSLTDFILRVLLPRFEVVLSYDLGNGIRVEKGGEVFSQWPRVKEDPQLARAPLPATETITQYLRYASNLVKLGRPALQIGVFFRSASLTIPNLRGSSNYDVSALALHVRDWASDPSIMAHPVATFLLTENISDLHPLVVNNPRVARIAVPLPSPDELRRALDVLAPKYQKAIGEMSNDLDKPAGALAGATLAAVEGMLKTRQHAGTPMTDADLAGIKKQMVERDTGGLIDFIKPDRTLDDVHGMEKVKTWLHQDIRLWKDNDLAALPMGYLFCGPVGTGKTYIVECLAGSAGVPVVKLKNFRDKWVGSTEANLETVFRLLHALGRCLVFIDEADQALGKRQADSGDSGVGGRVYSMFAEEMSNTRNRGKIVWILASSRPDLIEVDLKRPGRIDVKIPLLPTTTPQESYGLLRALCKKRGLELAWGGGGEVPKGLEPRIPLRLTPGSAEALAVKLYRHVRTTQGATVESALHACLEDYQAPVPSDVMQFQIDLAVREASDLDFVPEVYRRK